MSGAIGESSPQPAKRAAVAITQQRRRIRVSLFIEYNIVVTSFG